MCDPILVTLLKMQPHYSQSSRENATPSSGTSLLASYKEVPPPGRLLPAAVVRSLQCKKFRSVKVQTLVVTLFPPSPLSRVLERIWRLTFVLRRYAG